MKAIQSRFFALGLLFFTLSWLLANHYGPWVAFHSEALSCAAVGVMSAGLLMTSHHINLPKISVPIVFVAFIPWLQLIVGVDSYLADSLFVSFYIGCLVSAMTVMYARSCASANEAQPVGWVSLAYAIFVAALFSAAIGLAQWLNLADWLGIYAMQANLGDRASGNMGQANQLATLLLMGLASLCYLFEKKAVGVITLTVAVFFLTITLVLTQSRSAMLSAIVVCCVVIWKMKSIKMRLSPSAVIGWLISYFSVIALLPSISNFLLIAGTRSVIAPESVSQRWLIWKQVFYAIWQSPWVGYGWNQTTAAGAVGSQAFPGSITYTNAHNIVLDLMSWCGIPIGILISCIIFYWFFSRIFACKNNEAVWSMMALIPIAIHSNLEFPHAYAYFLISAGFLVGIVEAFHVNANALIIRHLWLWLPWSVGAVFSVYAVIEYLQVEEDFRIVRFESLRTGKTPDEYIKPDIWMLSHLSAMLSAARIAPSSAMSSEDLEKLRKTSNRFDYAFLRCNYALSLGLNDRIDESSRQMNIIYNMYGNNYYKNCETEFIFLQKQHPKLANIKIPKSN